jgi:hypothetical protein
LGGAVFQACGRLVLAGFVALEQGILLELPFDILGQLHMGQLQQLDRLLQLRRHHQ